MSKLTGHIAINEENKVFYIPEEDSIELTALRVLDGKEFDVIDLAKIDDNLIKHLQKI